MKPERELTMVGPSRNDEIAESVKVTMKTLKDFYGVRGSSRQAHLRAIGSEFGHIVAKNISASQTPQDVLKEIALFWNDYGMGEMELHIGDPTTFTLRHCYDCLGVESSDSLCGFKEGFVNAILNDRTGGIGSAEEIECCTTGREQCLFEVKVVHRGPLARERLVAEA